MISFILGTAPIATKVTQETSNLLNPSQLDTLIQQIINMSVSAGKNILVALLIFIIGRFLISLIKKLISRTLERRNVEVTIQTFLKSLINILLTILLVVSVVGALGVNTTSFAALLASAGIAIGMALSGNLQNLAGGIIILLFKPYKVGDWIEAQSVSGSVSEIQIFHTILVTADNKVVYIPNGSMSSGVVVNYSRKDTRRIEWIIGVDYGENVDKVENIIKSIITADTRILKDPSPHIALHALANSSVNITIRVWVETTLYWDVYFDMNKHIYDEFNKQGINFPFPQLTIHQG